MSAPQGRPTVRAMRAVIPDAARAPAWERRDTKRISVAELEVLHVVASAMGGRSCPRPMCGGAS